MIPHKTVTRTVSIDSGGHRARVLARRNELVCEHLDLVRQIAANVARTLPPSFDLDDLQATGYLALLNAATRYRPLEHGGAPFSAFARPAIRGAIIESCRRNRYTENTRPPIDELNPPSTSPAHDDAIDAERLGVRMREALSWLPEDQVEVLAKYYGSDGPTPAQARQRLGIAGPATRKRHADAIAGLRARFRIRGAA